METKTARFCIIIGAMKCGTGTLFNLLGQHRDVIPSAEKEPGFFSFPHVYERGFEWYTELWASQKNTSTKAPIFLEASTHYTKEPNISSGAHLISKHLTNVALIYIVRDPIQRIESQADFDLMRGRLLSRVDYTDEHFLNVTRYMHQIQPYIELFGREKILILDFSDLISRTDETLQKVARFVGIDPVDFSKVKAGHRNRTPTRVSKYSQILRWAAYHQRPPWVRSLWVRGFLYICCLPLKLVTVKRTRMTDAERKKVLELLSSDIRAFRETFGWYPMSEDTAKITEFR